MFFRNNVKNVKEKLSFLLKNKPTLREIHLQIGKKDKIFFEKFRVLLEIMQTIFFPVSWILGTKIPTALHHIPLQAFWTSLNDATYKKMAKLSQWQVGRKFLMRCSERSEPKICLKISNDKKLALILHAIYNGTRLSKSIIFSRFLRIFWQNRYSSWQETFC